MSTISGAVQNAPASQVKVPEPAPKLPAEFEKVYDELKPLVRNLPSREDWEEPKELILYSKEFSNGQVHLLSPFKKLETLHVAYHSLNDAGIASLPVLPALKELYITDRGTGFTRQSVELILQKYPNLEELGLYRFQQANESADLLAKFSQLKYLGLGRSNLANDGLSKIAGNTGIESLNLCGCMQVTEGAGPHLAKMKKLQELNLCLTRSTNAVAKHLVKLAELKTLNITYTAIDAEGLKTLSQAPSIEVLKGYNLNLTEGAREALLGFPALKKMQIQMSMLTMEGYGFESYEIKGPSWDLTDLEEKKSVDMTFTHPEFDGYLREYGNDPDTKSFLTWLSAWWKSRN